LIFTAIAESGVDDVRPVVQFYKEQGGTDFLETFRINQARLLAEEQQRLAEQKARQASKTQLGGGFSTFRAKNSMVSTHNCKWITLYLFDKSNNSMSLLTPQSIP